MAPHRVCYHGTIPGLYGASAIRSTARSSFLNQNHWTCNRRLTRSFPRSTSVGPVCLFGFGRKKKRQPTPTTEFEGKAEEKYEDRKGTESATGETFVGSTQEISRSPKIESAPPSNDIIPAITSTRENESSVSQEASMPILDDNEGQDSQTSDGVLPLPWWSDLPYICVLNLRSCGGLFMLDTGSGDEQEFSLIAFEDPREAHVVKSSLSKDHSSRLNLFRQDRKSLFRNLGIKPEDPSDWDSIVEMTWLSPTEFASVLKKSKSSGKVVPAGTFMNMPERVNDLRKLVDEIKQACGRANEDNAGISTTDTADVIQQVRRMQGLKSAESLSDTKHHEPFVDGGDPTETGEWIDPAIVADIKEAPNALPKRDKPEAFQEATLSSSMDNEHVEEQPDSESLKPSTSRASFSTQNAWWMKITQLHVPQAKQAGSPGGVVEINFAVIPDYTDYRLVLFEDLEDAQQFLGVFGVMLGEEARVRVRTQTPEDFVSTADGVKLRNAVVFGKGTLQVSRKMSYQQLVGAMRFATQVTARKHGEKIEDNIPQELAEQVGIGEAEVEGPMKSAAKSMVSAVEEVIKNPNRSKNEGNQGNRKPESFEEMAREENEFSSLLDTVFMDSISNARKESSDSGNGAPMAQKARNGSMDTAAETDMNTRSSAESAGPESFAERSTVNGIAPDTSSDLLPTTSKIVSDAEVLPSPSYDTGKGEEEDDVQVYYPPGWSKESQGKSEGPLWFLKLPVIFLPRYEDQSGELTLLALHANDEGKPLILGFQDRNDAHYCAEVIGAWEEHRGRPTNVIPIPPSTLMEWCQQESPPVDPVILRKGSMPLRSGMDREEFISVAGMFAMVQRGDFSSFQE